MANMKRKKRSRKGDNGRVLVIGGSEEYPGAVYLASVAALRMGADLVRIAAPEKVAWTINSLCPDLITIKLKGDFITARHNDIIREAVDWSDVVLIGNGMGQRKSTADFIRKIIRENRDKKKVIDADAIKAVRLQDVNNSILTPHRKEFEILLDNSGLDEGNISDRLEDNIILLKGHVDRIISRDRTSINRTGNPGMTVGGTGDVLSGICAGLLCQGRSLFDSARLGARLNGQIGDRLQKKLGFGFIASDFLEELSCKSKII